MLTVFLIYLLTHGHKIQRNCAFENCENIVLYFTYFNTLL